MRACKYFRALLGPVRTEKETYFEVIEVDDAGHIEEIGDGPSPADANAYVDESVCDEDDDGVLVPRLWLGTPSLVESLRLGTEHIGTPSDVQRRAVLLSAFTKLHDVRGEDAWDAADLALEAALVGLGMLSDRTLPSRQSWTVRAQLERRDEAPRTLYAWVNNGTDSLTIACTDSEPELLELIRSSAFARRPMVRNFRAVMLDRTHGWFGNLTRELLPVGVEPTVVCHLDWSEFAYPHPRCVLELGCIAAAFAVSSDGVAGGEADVEIETSTIRCVLRQVEVVVGSNGSSRP